jgi:hypothetical protein
MLAGAVFAQDGQPATEPSPAPAAAPAPEAAPGPVISELHGISIGMTADQVKDKLGKPDTSDAATMYYDLENGESLQLRLDADKNVMMVAVIYSGREAKAPTFAEVLGPDTPVITKENGSIYKQVRYPAKGVWVSYSKLALDSGPMTTVTIQKIPQ